MSQEKSIHCAAVELDISRSSVQRMLRKSMKAFCIKLQTVHKLKESHDRRLEMCQTLLNHCENDPSILHDIGFSDEAVFHLSGRLNWQNTRVWETENPKPIREKEGDSSRLVVQCGISAKKAS